VGNKRLLAIIAAAGFGLLVVFYGALFAFTGNKIPGDATVLGIPLGGLTEEEAKQKLADGLKDRTGRVLVFSAGERKFAMKPSSAGLSVDIDATVSAAGAGRSLNPARMLRVLTGGEPVEPVIKADEDKLKVAIERLVKQVNRAPTEGSITFGVNEGKAEAVAHKPAEGVTLDPEQAEEAVLDAYPAAGEPFALPVTTAKPTVGTDALDQAMADYAQPAVSAPIELAVGDKRVELSPEELAPALKLTINPDRSHTPTLDAKKLEPLFQKRFKDLETLPKDATIELRGGKPTVVPAVDGMVVDRAKVVPAILATLPKAAGQRMATVGLAKKPAKFTTAAAQKLGVKEKISEFTTEFPHADYRNTNIGRAAELINGTLLKPNEVFSLNKVVGERTAANGFTDGYIINRGVLVKDLGGGVSQSATTTFNAAFFAGLEDVEHKAHSFYISRYPVGREATVAWPSVDLKFRNDSGHGVLIETGFRRSAPGSAGAITVRMWGTKVWDITAGQSKRFNGRAPKVIYNEKPGCERQAPVAGFDIKIYRYFNRDGGRIKTESFTTHYNAADDIRCGKKPPTPPPTPPTPGR
jgi:vancomycin resistance protein YoaR